MRGGWGKWACSYGTRATCKATRVMITAESPRMGILGFGSSYLINPAEGKQNTNLRERRFQLLLIQTTSAWLWYSAYTGLRWLSTWWSIALNRQNATVKLGSWISNAQIQCSRGIRLKWICSAAIVPATMSFIQRGENKFSDSKAVHMMIREVRGPMSPVRRKIFVRMAR